jgi:hypothetical protein
MTFWIPTCNVAINGVPGTGDAVAFDTNDNLNTGAADLTSNADSKVGILSFWIKPQTGTDGTNRRVYTSQAGVCTWSISTTNKLNINCGSSLDMTSTRSITESDGWTHVLAAWDVANSYAEMWIDDVDDNPTVGTLANTTIDYTRSGHWLFSDTTDGTRIKADIFDFYFNNAEWLNINLKAVRRKFITSAGKPANLGADGSTPTGNDPIVFLHIDDAEAAANFAVNAGYGGNFTVVGTLSTAATSPVD